MKENSVMGREREGFSLVELIVTIALMVIFVGLAALSIGLLTASDSKGLASHFIECLTDLKADSEQNSGPRYLHVYKSTDGFYAIYDDKKNGTFTIPSDNSGAKKIGSANLKMNASFAAGADAEITGNAVVTVGIKKKDGSFDTDTPRYVEIEKDGVVEYRVVLARDTGLHYID